MSTPRPVRSRTGHLRGLLTRNGRGSGSNFNFRTTTHNFYTLLTPCEAEHGPTCEHSHTKLATQRFKPRRNALNRSGPQLAPPPRIRKTSPGNVGGNHNFFIGDWPERPSGIRVGPRMIKRNLGRPTHTQVIRERVLDTLLLYY